MQKIKSKSREEEIAESLLPILIELKKQTKKSKKTRDDVVPILTQDMIDLLIQQKLS
jgi:hypothetical protein